ncbi:methionine--tRNA ligase [Barrientosiimonas marina]|uniref:Methionine--tRNA ligase n=1 Tax=Lentibacillus kimchii TaxID=1542911 RepID=A0ABW2UW93_9BACI
MNVFIGGAWPYANGSLHLGHISSLLPGDILARYFRSKGEEVLFVSGSDCNGTPIAIQAKKEGLSTQELSDKYHREFKRSFENLGFSYDMYSRTDGEEHHEVVKEVFLRLLEEEQLYLKEVEQCYCDFCEQFLPDRFVEGECPYCNHDARGDQCDNCSKILDPSDLFNQRCKVCHGSPVSKKTEHFYLKLSTFQKELEQFVKSAKDQNRWRDNAIQLTERYLEEGLHDRAVSRDLPNGVSVPVNGYENKKIYVWIEAVSGYYSASKEWAKLNNKDINQFWNEDTVSYYVHGKDNIPFHTIIWPSILSGINNKSLPDYIISNEYLTLEQRKLSTSKNWAVWAEDLLSKYHPDSIRYFLTVNAPESRDANFSFREFIYSHNSELLGAYGNFVNRALKFINKSYEGITPKGELDVEIRKMVQSLYERIGHLISDGKFKKALEEIFDFIRYANKYFDEEQPWIQIKEDIPSCNDTMASCVYIIANLSKLLSPFLPFSSKKVQEMLNLNSSGWEELLVSGIVLNDVKPLFERIDNNRIEEELTDLYDGMLK